MASLSLPRVLHPRKTSLEIERENFEKSQQQALHKAINIHETPVKQKHVRSAIIGTFHTQGGKTFWALALRLPAMEDRIIAWKLCHVVHKILREGHPMCLLDSQRHSKYLDEIGKLWCHLPDGYGKMIRLYTSLLMTKLEFHKRNPRFPGHLGVTPEELESIAANDINSYFEMSVEMFDYLDNILDLQSAVFGSLNMARSNSMTNSGQCRLAPLIPCIQDASKLYDYCVKILFRLHFSLPQDTLSGHRSRFNKIFKMLKEFYNNTTNLQYFKDLISIPSLPDVPPNFLIQSELGTYVTQEVIVPQEQEPEDEPPNEGTLIDTTYTEDQVDIPDSRLIIAEAEQRKIFAEKEYLQSKCEKLKTEYDLLSKNHQQELKILERRMRTLETDLCTKDNELMEERREREIQHLSQNKVKDDKEEKFNQLIGFYNKTRTAHIQLLREKGEVEKKLEAALDKIDEAERTKIDLDSKISELMLGVSKAEEKLQNTSFSQQKELDNIKRDKELFDMEIEILKKTIRDCDEKCDGLQLELANISREKEELYLKYEESSNKYRECQQQMDTMTKERDLLIKDVVSRSIDNNKDILQYTIKELENPAVSALSCNPDYLRNLSQDCTQYLDNSKKLSYTDYPLVITISNNIGHHVSMYILLGRATSNLSRDINLADRMEEACKVLGQLVLNILDCMKVSEETDDVVGQAIKKLEEINNLAESISVSLTGEKKENLDDLLENEMMEMDKAIEEAAKKIQEMLTKSRAADSGLKLEVNSKILDSCTDLMQAVRILVQKSKFLQAEIVGQGRGTASAKEFYKRNHQWTDGFISAAKAVAASAKFLLTAADKVVTVNGKFELLMVAAQETAASTAQLVVASRVKADRNSNNLQQLTHASKTVSKATATVVATTKDCRQLLDEEEELDTSKLTLHRAKKLEMEAQVRVLELEKELDQERLHLAALRRHHYQLAGED